MRFTFFPIIIFVLLFSNENMFSQNKSHIEIILLSQNDSLPIENAHLVIKQGEKQTIYVSNHKGVFKLKNTLNSKKLNAEFSALGYESLYVDSLIEKTFYINQKVSELSEVVILSKNNNNKGKLNRSLFNRLNKSKRNFSWLDRSAVYIPYDSKKENLPILKIKYKTTNFKGVKGIEYMPFIANIYSVDDKTGLPGKPLLDNIIISKEIGVNWAVVDVSNENILIPKEGVYIIYEILNKDYYNSQMLQSQVGAISAVPALETFKFDENYAFKSYDFFSVIQRLPTGHLANGRVEAIGWVLVNWHYIIKIVQ